MISVVTITILITNDEWLKPKMSRICLLPIPIQLIAVIAGTLASKYFDLSANYNITSVGHIPTGFPGLPRQYHTKSFFPLNYIF